MSATWAEAETRIGKNAGRSKQWWRCVACFSLHGSRIVDRYGEECLECGHPLAPWKGTGR